MLDVRIVNKECEKMDFTGDGSELMNELEFVVGSVLYTMIEQGGFDKEDLEDILDIFVNNVEATVEDMEQFFNNFKKLC